MTVCLNKIYNNVNLLNNVNKQELCSTTFKVIKASQPIFPIFLPHGILTGIKIAQKSYTLATKIDNLYRQYFCLNKKPKHSKRLYSRTKKFRSYSKKRRRTKKTFPSKQIIDISLTGISLHTIIYKSFFGQVVGNLEKTIDSLIQIYTLSPTENSKNIEKTLTLVKNILVLFAIVGGYEQIMLSIYLLQSVIAITKIFIENNNEEYLAVYTQVLWVILSLFQIYMFYEKSLEKTQLLNKKVV